MYIKEFDKWNNVKKRINTEHKDIFIRKGEIRWAIVGVNVGSEIDGKGDYYTRPVLIVDVIGSKLILGVPLSTNIKEIPGRYILHWKNNINSVCINQIKVFSSKRILSRKGKISDSKLKSVKDKINTFYSFV